MSGTFQIQRLKGMYKAKSPLKSTLKNRPYDKSTCPALQWTCSRLSLRFIFKSWFPYCCEDPVMSEIKRYKVIHMIAKLYHTVILEYFNIKE